MADKFDLNKKDLESRRKELESAGKVEINELNSLQKQYEKLLEKQNAATMRALANFAAGRTESSKYQASLADQMDTQLENLQEQIDLQQEASKVNQANRVLEQKRIEEQVKGLERTQEALNKKAAVYNDIAGTLKNIPGIGGILSDVFSKAAKKVKETGNSAAGFLSVMESIATVAGPSALIKSMLDVSNQTQDISRNLGIGFEAAREMRAEFSQIAAESNDVRINSIDLVKAQGQLVNSLGLSVATSGEVSQNFIRNSEYLGASVEAAGRLEKIITITGGSSTEFTESLALAANETGRLYGVNLPLAKVVEKISNLQGATLSYIMQSPTALAKAVAISEKLGIEFSKIRGIADNLVNFESSITAELEAEVFLGRDINLNKARQLAFMGDEVGLAEEIGRQIGTTADLNAMLPIQQQSFAKALGLSRDELANMVMQQELSNRFGAQARDLTVEQMQAAKKLAEDKGISDGAALRLIQEEVSATKQFEDSAQKIRAAFQDAVVKFAPMIETVAKVVGTLAKSPFAQVLAVGGALLGTGLAAFKAIRGLTPATAMYVKDAFGGGGTAGGGVRSFSMGGKSLSGAQMAGIGAGGLVAGLAGQAVKSNAKTAGMSAFGGALSGAGMGASFGMIAGPYGAAAGAVLGAVYGGITGYLDKQEAQRESKRTQIQKEIDERGAVAEELRMLRRVMEEKDTTIQMDGTQVGKVLTKGVAMHRTLYDI